MTQQSLSRYCPSRVNQPFSQDNMTEFLCRHINQRFNDELRAHGLKQREPTHQFRTATCCNLLATRHVLNVLNTFKHKGQMNLIFHILNIVSNSCLYNFSILIFFLKKSKETSVRWIFFTWKNYRPSNGSSRFQYPGHHHELVSCT